ncbi:XdhC/CoxI family protein [Streptomyces sp. DSM 41524]|uniref:XdhC/CoxI family protein n=1 Tax=Streptomyces asiaticus subsp. ignotus TaxID=3098222 RepID=A0ABU7Q9X6_9ACTN|nr:XdhC/CoxI family protein [Streptomyces sp. DSM 41524]
MLPRRHRHRDGVAVHELLPELSQWFISGERFALVTVVNTFSSAPRPPGAAMAVSATHGVIGSVSGGCVESAAYDLAQETIASGVPVLRRFGVSDDDAFAVGLTCGGIIDLFVEPVDASSFPQFQALADATTRRDPVAVATYLEGPGPVGAHRLITAKDAVGTFGDDELDASVTEAGQGLLEIGETRTVYFGPRGERMRGDVAVFVRSFAQPPRMVVFGAIDFAAAVVRIGKYLGYYVTLCDARPVFATRARFPDADEIVVDWPHTYLEANPPDERTVLCVLTHDPKFDAPLLAQALPGPAAYVGAMGSRRTHQLRLADLRERGVTEEQLARLHSPVGLDLGGRTPEETAISIAAQIIACRNGASARPLSATHGSIHRPAPDHGVPLTSGRRL